MTYKHKITLSFIVVYILAFLVTYPLISHSVDSIVFNAMETTTQKLIDRLKTADNEEALVNRLKEYKYQLFVRVSIINYNRKILYDTHIKRLLGPAFSPDYIIHHPEIDTAFSSGSGYHEDYSELIEQRFKYYAKAFTLEGKTYVIRTSFPYSYYQALENDFKSAFFLTFAILFAFLCLTLLGIFHYFSRPIAYITKEVSAYQKGLGRKLPRIQLQGIDPKDDFGQLGLTLNALSDSIEENISRIKIERNLRERILESLEEGIVTINNNGIVEYYNSTASLLLQSFELNKHIEYNQSFPKPLIHLIELALSNNQTTRELLEVRWKGARQFIDVTIIPSKMQRGIIIVLVDKTSHYGLLEMRRDFIANASHELKTPITIIKGFSETLYDNPDLPKETVAMATSKMFHTCERMTSLINDLLALSNLDRLSIIQVHECNLNEIIQKSIGNVQDLNTKTTFNLSLLSDDDAILWADKSLLELMINNIFTNAIKYCKKDPIITVKLSVNATSITIEISDNGIGIPQDLIDKVFERFFTVDKSHSRKLGGSGLGLSLVEQIVHKHHGKISLSSEINVGTTFKIIIPRDLNSQINQLDTIESDMPRLL